MSVHLPHLSLHTDIQWDPFITWLNMIWHDNRRGGTWVSHLECQGHPIFQILSWESNDGMPILSNSEKNNPKISRVQFLLIKWGIKQSHLIFTGVRSMFHPFIYGFRESSAWFKYFHIISFVLSLFKSLLGVPWWGSQMSILAFSVGIHRWLVDSPHKGSVM